MLGNIVHTAEEYNGKKFDSCRKLTPEFESQYNQKRVGGCVRFRREKTRHNAEESLEISFNAN